MVETFTMTIMERKDISLHLPLPPNAPPSSLSELAIQSIRFLLYQRQQIPEPILLLKKSHFTNGVKGSSTKLNSVQIRQHSQTKRQVCSFLEKLLKLENFIGEAFSEGSARELHFSIGATPISVKEIYCIHFTDFQAGESSSTVSPQVEKLCCRKLCSTLFQQDENFLDTANISNVHVFVKAKKGSLVKGWLPWPQYKLNDKKIQMNLILSPNLESSKKIEENKENLDVPPKNRCVSDAKCYKTSTNDSSCNGDVQKTESATAKHPETDSTPPLEVSFQSSTVQSDVVSSGDSKVTTKDEMAELSQSSTQDLIAGELSNLDLESESQCDSTPFVWYKSSISLKGFKY